MSTELHAETQNFSFIDNVMTYHHAVREFPKYVVVRSNHTGRVITFVANEEAAIANEFWDGMQMEYRACSPCRVRKLVLLSEIPY